MYAHVVRIPLRIEYIRRVLRALSLGTQPLIPPTTTTLRHTLQVLPGSILVPVKGYLPSYLYSIVHSVKDIVNSDINAHNLFYEQ